MKRLTLGTVIYPFAYVVSLVLDKVLSDEKKQEVISFLQRKVRGMQEQSAKRELVREIDELSKMILTVPRKTPEYDDMLRRMRNLELLDPEFWTPIISKLETINRGE